MSAGVVEEIYHLETYKNYFPGLEAIKLLESFRKEGLRKGFGYGCEIFRSFIEPEKLFECCQLISDESSVGTGELT